ncbi:sigma-54 dependent transcriptional regulator [Salibacteraceae bacterium]|jgi:DNA-binding NtrC family response regulator|nr:response regulator [Crocinitomicaceae bacterium]MDB9725455.1 sigma-54 dependent transcriptional regulator [Salibacteraceae bacterium]|tara:strand:+ start:10330 stop:11487 length:1158 start_codon:yes stop_codon:yes gene_type:complete
MASILVIDDEKSIRNSLRDVLEYEGHSIAEAENGMEGLSSIRSDDFDLVLCDIKMPKMDGSELLEMALESKPELNIIMISGHGDIETAVDCIKKGAYDYLAKPLDLNRLLVIVRNGLDKGNLVTETKTLKKKIKRYSNSKIIGSSEAINGIHEIIAKVAPTDARVLITGPNGSGKELIANALHNQSNRAKNPFIEVNCAAIPSELIESELFGHEKGAFTSAIKTKKGKFEQAEGGTIFLDEIGDMSASAQAKVLRALQENKITRVGGEKEIKVNVRVLAATNKNLKEEIKESRFREDLYHRLSVILIENPSLNERKSDIPELANFFLNIACTEMGVAQKEISNSAIKELTAKDWTGNIRELKNVIERLVILSGSKIEKEDVQKYA